MEVFEMLCELRDMVDDDEINNDLCSHEEPENTDIEDCHVCFILNLSNNVSMLDPGFTEETTELQRDAVIHLWERYCNS